jgi:exopolyphosphatase/guanosine-5'-triphosphate,3'-diphosphate pyrophosphatase
VPVGAVRYTERFGLASVVDPGCWTMPWRPSQSTWPASMAARRRMRWWRLAGGNQHHGREARPDHLPSRAGPGAVLDRAEIDRQIELYRSRDTEARRAIVGLQPKRAEVILAGACIVRTVMDKLGQQTLTVSDRGLRHGLLIDRFGT